MAGLAKTEESQAHPQIFIDKMKTMQSHESPIEWKEWQSAEIKAGQESDGKVDQHSEKDSVPLILSNSSVQIRDSLCHSIHPPCFPGYPVKLSRVNCEGMKIALLLIG